MDTASHLLFGATLAGTAQLVPAVHGNMTLSAAILCASLIGSHAPDLDAVFRFKGVEAYVKHHRGWSHSLPALLLWPALFGTLTAWAFGEWAHWLLIAVWTLLAVVVHVTLDLTNAYGVQCLLPLRRGWYHLDALCLTEPFLIVLHVASFASWIAGWRAGEGWSFLFAWVATAVYAACRIAHHGIVVRRIKARFPGWRAAHVLPDLVWTRWHFIVLTDDGYRMGRVEGTKLYEVERLPYEEAGALSHDCVRVSRGTAHVKALLHFAKRAYVKWQAQPEGGYLVTWTDLRFWRERDWPFRAEVRLDDQLNVVEQKLGWHKKAWEPPFV